MKSQRDENQNALTASSSKGQLPMGRADYLLSHLAQECNEIAVRCTKAQMFGLTEIQPGQDRNNADRIMDELNDLWAMVEILQIESILPVQSERDKWAAIGAKQRKAQLFSEYSVARGRLAATT